MALDALQKNPNPPNQVSYIKASAIGALSGYALKYLIPVTSVEKDDAYNAALKQNRLSATGQQAVAIRNLKSQLKKDTFDGVKHSEEQAKETITIGKKYLDATTKSIRPTHVFVGVGLLIGFLSALTTNILRRIDYYNAQHYSEHK
jgi:hypothetical protein